MLKSISALEDDDDKDDDEDEDDLADFDDLDEVEASTGAAYSSKIRSTKVLLPLPGGPITKMGVLTCC